MIKAKFIMTIIDSGSCITSSRCDQLAGDKERFGHIGLPQVFQIKFEFELYYFILINHD